MAGPQHRTAEHRRQRKAWAAVVEQGNAWCAERACLMPTRWIPPGTAWDVLHDETGTYYRGVGHARCNRSEGAARGNRQRGRATKLERWPL